MSYFKQFPLIEYNFNRTGKIQNMVDIYRSVRPLPSFLDDINGYKYYEIIDGERPDIVSTRLYGTPEYYWTFFIINDFLHDGISVWPMSQSELSDYIKTEYAGVVITTRPKVIFDTDGLVSEYRDSLAGRFQLGETITGSVVDGPGLTGSGTLFMKNVDMNQLILKDVDGFFIGDPESVQEPNQVIKGVTTDDSVTSYRAYDYAEAPQFYFESGDSERRPVDLGTNIQSSDTGEYDTGIPESNIDYVSNRQFLFERNEQRSKIRVIDPEYISQFAKTFKGALNK